ncbi:MAG TPA: N-acetylmuramoyl-L-alanine amidase [Anaeromyxobacter sp.]|nr:N-acetylmuramoyl-L-alanine amidase [Anaeromyxobacter sp.]
MVALLLAALLAGSPIGRGPAAPREAPFVVVLDPGHGGDQDGALSPGGLKEKDLTLEIAQRVGAVLRKGGMRVVLTRTGDLSVPLANRAAIANAIHADLFLSIHLNSMPTAEQRQHTSGIETYFLSADATDAHANAVAARENADRLAGEDPIDPADPVAAILSDLADADTLAGSSRLAYGLHERLVAALGVEDRGVKQAPFYVLAGARMPAALLELGFISHPADAARLVTRPYQQRIAEAIGAAIQAYRRETGAVRR